MSSALALSVRVRAGEPPSETVAAFDTNGPSNETDWFMLRRAVHLLLCATLILVSGPLAPCKVEHALTKFSVGSMLTAGGRTVLNTASLSRRGAADQGDDDDADGSCWCSVHMSVQDAGGAALDAPVVVAFLAPPTVDLLSVRAEAPRPASYALEPPTSLGARSLPLLI